MSERGPIDLSVASGGAGVLECWGDGFIELIEFIVLPDSRRG